MEVGRRIIIGSEHIKTDFRFLEEDMKFTFINGFDAYILHIEDQLGVIVTPFSNGYTATVSLVRGLSRVIDELYVAVAQGGDLRGLVEEAISAILHSYYMKEIQKKISYKVYQEDHISQVVWQDGSAKRTSNIDPDKPDLEPKRNYCTRTSIDEIELDELDIKESKAKVGIITKDLEPLTYIGEDQ